MKARKLALLILLGLTLAPASMSQIKHIEMRVEGMTCNFCTYGVKQFLKRQPGVQKAEVSLIDGKVDVTPTEAGQIVPAQLLKATYDSGVTVAEMIMTARGKVVKDSAGNIAFRVEPNQLFAIVPNDSLNELEPLADSATTVTVRGELYRRPAGEKEFQLSGPLTLLILDVQKRP